MSTELLSCPACGAAASLPPAGSIGTCSFCGARYRVSGGHALEVAGGRSAGRSLVGMIGVAAALVVAVAGAVLVLRRAEPASTHTHAAKSVDPTQRPVDALDPAAQASAKFTFHHLRKGAGGDLSLFGEVKNDSETIINKPEVIAVLRDAGGAELRTASGYAERDHLLPGATSPIQIRVDDPPAYTALSYEVVARKASYVPVYVAGLVVEPVAPRAASLGMVELTGKVKNTGAKAARFVHIEALALDAEGKILGIDSSYAKADVLRPGEEARYRMLIFPSPDPVDHYSFSATGRVAD